MHNNKELICKKFSYLHPLIVQRSLEKAKSDGELFDILSMVPNTRPIIWSEKERRWIRTDIFEL